MEGSILSVYQESPGPDGRTILQCQLGQLSTWLDATIQVTFDAGTSIQTVLEKFKSTIGAHQVVIGKSKAQNLKLKTIYEHDGTIRDGLTKLQNQFADEKLYVFLRNDTLCAVCITTEDYIASHKLQYLSAPVQPNAGTEDGGYMTLTGPWLPQLSMGDMLEVPAKVYMRYLTTVNRNAGNSIFIQVSEMSIHFGTTGGVNSMTVKGATVKVKK